MSSKYRFAGDVWVFIQQINGKTTAMVADKQKCENAMRYGQSGYNKLPGMYGPPEMVKAPYFVAPEKPGR